MSAAHQPRRTPFKRARLRSSTSINDILPAEVIDHIIDAVADRDKASVKTLALVSKDWVARSRYHTFSDRISNLSITMRRAHPATYSRFHECLLKGLFIVKNSLEVSFSDLSSPGYIDLHWDIVSSVGCRYENWTSMASYTIWMSHDFTNFLASLSKLTYLKINLSTQSDLSSDEVHCNPGEDECSIPAVKLNPLRAGLPQLRELDINVQNCYIMRWFLTIPPIPLSKVVLRLGTPALEAAELAARVIGRHGQGLETFNCIPTEEGWGGHRRVQESIEALLKFATVWHPVKQFELDMSQLSKSLGLPLDTYAEILALCFRRFPQARSLIISYRHMTQLIAFNAFQRELSKALMEHPFVNTLIRPSNSALYESGEVEGGESRWCCWCYCARRRRWLRDMVDAVSMRFRFLEGADGAEAGRWAIVREDEGKKEGASWVGALMEGDAKHQAKRVPPQ
ncbi:hypothetical protein DFP72DRAFT_1098149 [Ephemerocybe angulata]|uniref:Uncharacterized protein n=1 Tax=Ephemerocybe angulata TaxID=980116 RepID=A0A8H6LV20_9AGAR|nr:hypothetical protein DFP72DRAFT_1098149 [Tulosesus angulatus]